MKLFTVGPVEMYPKTLEIEGTQNPYFRTSQFGEMMKEVERYFLKSINASDGTLFAGLTCSGTGAMEASVTNVLNKNDKVLVINGGSFGARFGKICEAYGIPHEEYALGFGEAFDKNEFENYSGKGFTALLVQACETSTGQKYDLEYLGDFCKKNNMYFIVDAVSAYLADLIDMDAFGIDILFTASQKALALSPGVSLIAMSGKVFNERVSKAENVFYLNLKDYVENQRRGQPPFTSAVGAMIACHQRLEDIDRRGVSDEIERHRNRAEHFRRLAESLPVRLPDFDLSNCCTPIIFDGVDAYALFEKLKDEKGFTLTPSGGDWAKKQLRVGHLGNLDLKDYDDMVAALVESIELLQLNKGEL